MSYNPRILVIGDFILDEYVYGECTRISPEAPVPVVAEQRRITVDGGAGNVVANLLALGADVTFWYGEKCSYKMRIVAGHQQVCRLDNDDLRVVDPPENLQFLVQTSDLVVLSDYKKGVVNPKVYSALNTAIAIYPRPLLVDPYDGFCDYGNFVTVIKPNRKEAESVVGFKITDEHTLDSAGRIYLGMSRAEYVVITLGAEGAAVFKANGQAMYRSKEPVQQVFDVTGAGDTFIATLAYMWEDRDFSVGPTNAHLRAVDWATKAAGIVCGKLGTATITREELFGE